MASKQFSSWGHRVHHPKSATLATVGQSRPAPAKIGIGGATIKDEEQRNGLGWADTLGEGEHLALRCQDLHLHDRGLVPARGARVCTVDVESLEAVVGEERMQSFPRAPRQVLHHSRVTDRNVDDGARVGLFELAQQRGSFSEKLVPGEGSLSDEVGDAQGERGLGAPLALSNRLAHALRETEESFRENIRLLGTPPRTERMHARARACVGVVLATAHIAGMSEHKGEVPGKEPP